jgi:peroxiredoxin
MSQKISVGAKLPDVTLRMVTKDGPKPVQTSAWFAGKKVVLFAVPGAFTPTCNNKHLPSFVEQAGALKAKGVDAIACTAVNDPFVLDAWSKAAGAADRITFLSDGTGEFAKAIGMSFDGAGHGLGTRSLRYAMVVQDGTVKALEVEESPGACSISSGSAILAKL